MYDFHVLVMPTFIRKKYPHPYTLTQLVKMDRDETIFTQQKEFFKKIPNMKYEILNTFHFWIFSCAATQYVLLCVCVCVRLSVVCPQFLI